MTSQAFTACTRWSRGPNPGPPDSSPDCLHPTEVLREAGEAVSVGGGAVSSWTFPHKGAVRQSTRPARQETRLRTPTPPLRVGCLLRMLGFSTRPPGLALIRALGIPPGPSGSGSAPRPPQTPRRAGPHPCSSACGRSPSRSRRSSPGSPWRRLNQAHRRGRLQRLREPRPVSGGRSACAGSPPRTASACARRAGIQSPGGRRRAQCQTLLVPPAGPAGLGRGGG